MAMEKITLTTHSARTAVLATAAALATALCVLVAAAAPATAAFGLASLDTDTHTPWDGVNPVRHISQAGAHADSTISFRFRRMIDHQGIEIPDGSVKDVVIDLPAGFGGNPQALPRCQPAAFANLTAGSCPAATQVGITTTELQTTSPDEPDGVLDWPTPVYNLVPHENETAAFGFYIVMVPVRISVSVRSDGDYGIRTTVSNISQGANVFGQRITLWGVPADPVHDHERYASGQLFPPGVPSGVARRPFLMLPPTCPGPLATRFAARAWGESGWITAEDVTDDPETGERNGPKGCDKLRFEAGLEIGPAETTAGTPAAYTATLRTAFDDNPNALGTAHVKEVSVKLPEGVALSPSSSDGLQGCSPEQLKLGSTEDSACPASSKIGEVEIKTPLLPEPLTGEVYLRKPTPDRLFAIALVARGSGVVVKLPGDVDPDPVTGRLTTTFRNNPQLSFEQLTLRFKGGPRAPLTNPQTCGEKTTTTTITSWAGHELTSTDTFTIDKSADGGACAPLGFSPAFSAGTANPAAGTSSAFALTFSRGDRDQDLRDISVKLPAGLTGRLALADQCPDALAATGGCAENSRIGSVTVGSGAGAQPYHLPGRVYMTGPYKGKPLGMAIVVPAVAGPFDLGTVVVRAGIDVDRTTAALTVSSDPMPTILEGVPLRVRTVNVRVDKPGFMINPTACDSKAIEAVIGSTGGTSANVRSRFRAADCGARPIAPKLSLAVGARGRTGAEMTTPLTATLTQTAGQGNLKNVSVNLPTTLNSRLQVVNQRHACSMEQFQAERCPNAIGSASAITPLLRDPLIGQVFLLRNPARRLPDMVVRLRGQGVTSAIKIDLVAKITVLRDLSLNTTFDAVPDVPISKFTLRLIPGRNGAIGVVRNLCTPASRAARAKLGFRGQNGKYVSRAQRLQIRGCARDGKDATAKPSPRRSASKRVVG